MRRPEPKERKISSVSIKDVKCEVVETDLKLYKGLSFEEYNQQYSSEVHKRQNEHLKQELLIHLEFDKKIVDLGCGTGLAYFMLKDRIKEYIGVDICSEYISTLSSMNLEKASFVCMDGLKYVKNTEIKHSNVLFLWSIEYIGTEAIDYIDDTNTIFIVSYNKPYLPGSGSIYEGKEEEFKKLHDSEKIQSDLRSKGLTLRKFMGEEYYFVATRKSSEQ